MPSLSLSLTDLRKFCSELNSLSLNVHSFQNVSVFNLKNCYKLKYDFEKEIFVL